MRQNTYVPRIHNLTLFRRLPPQNVARICRAKYIDNFFIIIFLISYFAYRRDFRIRRWLIFASRKYRKHYFEIRRKRALRTSESVTYVRRVFMYTKRITQILHLYTHTNDDVLTFFIVYIRVYEYWIFFTSFWWLTIFFFFSKLNNSFFKENSNIIICLGTG